MPGTSNGLEKNNSVYKFENIRARHTGRQLLVAAIIRTIVEGNNWRFETPSYSNNYDLHQNL